jgi:putative ABC transport system permease protein
MGITLAAGQLFSGTTASAAARDQAADGLRADYVVTSTSAGVSPELAGLLRDVPGVSAVTPVVRTRTLAPVASGDSQQIRTYAAQGVIADRLAETMDLAVLAGDVARVRGNTVALSRIAAGTLGAALGDTVDLRLGDGTPIRPTVVALYERGLGLGDVTLPHDLVLEHTTERLDFAVLIAADAGSGDALRDAVRHLPTVRVDDRESFVAAQREAAAGESAVGLILNAVLLGYLAIAVVNTLVMATAARFREFALLRLVGATRRQVLAMMRSETRIVVVAAVLIGTLAAIPSLVGTSLGLTRTPLPSIPPHIYLGIVAVAALLGWAAIMTSTRIAMRPQPVDAIGARE